MSVRLNCSCGGLMLTVTKGNNAWVFELRHHETVCPARRATWKYSCDDCGATRISGPYAGIADSSDIRYYDPDQQARDNARADTAFWDLHGKCAAGAKP